MKKTKVVSIVLIVMIVIAMLFTAKNVFAVDDLGYLLGNNVTSSEDSSKPANSTPSNNSLNNTTNNIVLTTNNTSTYNNSSLPKTGAGDVVPGIVLENACCLEMASQAPNMPGIESDTAHTRGATNPSVLPVRRPAMTISSFAPI